MISRAYIGLGSNLHDPLTQLRRALSALKVLPDSQLIACSRFYHSPPMGPANQPDYLNAVCALDTALAPLELLHALQAIEQAQGRERGERWGARTLDLDLLMYAAQVMTSAELVLPHPGLHVRDFVLLPLNEIAPTLDIPGHGPVHELAARCESSAYAMKDEDA